ncbi:hypothetical protein [Kitasatospora viridis]|uniref:Beta/gamma crystallin n=1 Tax=Kitasatospora viridis TaxID=281105 RepID=A0A561UNB8_9ACTN|nr:hypothetical protein [Kitasatospora viridis]TWG00847.1 hypothetical protein FHX73_114727 [Kitasatospora viridis]
MFRRTITGLAVAAAAVAGVVTAAPAQAATIGCSSRSPQGEQICVTSISYNRSIDVSTVHFTLSGPWTDYRVYANGGSDLYYPGSNTYPVDGHLTTSFCASEGTTHWYACS